jgi:hypothetical protein
MHCHNAGPSLLKELPKISTAPQEIAELVTFTGFQHARVIAIEKNGAISKKTVC